MRAEPSQALSVGKAASATESLAGAGQIDLQFCGARGPTHLSRRRVCYPYSLMSVLRTEQRAPGFATVIVQSASGGFFENERLLQRYCAINGAQACVTTQSIAAVHGMPGGGHAECSVELQVAANCYLEYRPRPVVLFPDSRLRQSIRVALAEGASVVVADGFLGHDPGAKHQCFAWIDSAFEVRGPSGRLLAADRSCVEGRDALNGLPGISRGIFCHGWMIAVSPSQSAEGLCASIAERCRRVEGLYAGASTLADGRGLFVRMAAVDALALCEGFSLTLASVRQELIGVTTSLPS